jgi:UDP-4-amino-4,6-dideoxy-N-acetyl-beta-L-altrosamine N-acetyltransferase
VDVRLRNIDKIDLQTIMTWRMSPDVTKYMYTDPKLTMEDQQKWFRNIQISSNSRYWIIQLGDGVDVGLLSLNQIDPYNKHCSWAYYIADTRARGHGLGRILECNIYDYVFDKLELNKLWCEVLHFNQSVVEIHKKFGSEVEGILKQHIYKDGIYYDVVRMAITRDRWQSIKGEFDYLTLAIAD